MGKKNSGAAGNKGGGIEQLWNLTTYVGKMMDFDNN